MAALRGLALTAHGLQLQLARSSSAGANGAQQLAVLQSIVDAVAELVASASSKTKEDAWFAAGEVVACAFGGARLAGGASCGSVPRRARNLHGMQLASCMQ